MNKVIEQIKKRASLAKKKIVLPETMDVRVLKAADIVMKEGIAQVILIGKEDEVKKNAKDLDLSGVEIIDPFTSSLTEEFVKSLYELRKEKGLTLEEAKNLILNDYMYFSCMLVKNGYADPDFIGFGLNEKEYMKQYSRIYYEKNIEKFKEYSKIYYQEHKEKLYEKNKERNKVWRENNREKYNEWQREYQLKKKNE